MNMLKISKVFSTIVVMGFLSFPQTSTARILEKVYAVVNGEIITLTEINDYQKKLKNGGFVNDLLFADPNVRQKAIGDRNYLIDRLIDEKIIDYEVKKNGFVVTADRVNKEIGTIAKKSSISTSELKRSLQRQKIDFVEYQDFVKKSIERRQLVEKEITSKIKISEQDIVAFYLTNNGGATSQVYEYQLSHILMPAGKKSEAEKVQKEAVSKDNFPILVEQHSTDSDSKKKGGEFGLFRTGEMIATIENSIKNLSIGEVSKVVKTPMGLHIFKLTDKKLVKDPQIEKQKPRIYQMLFARAFKEQLDFWLTKKRKEAIIQINES